MTTKQIAEATGKTERAVQKWVRTVSEYVSSIDEKRSASTSTYPADYNFEETCSIIEKGLGFEAASVYRNQAEQNAIVINPVDTIMIFAESVKAMNANTTAIMEMLKETRSRIDKVEYQQNQRAALLPAPQKDSRAELTQIVNTYAHQHKDNDFRAAWGDLYKEVYYRLRINLRVRAKNEGVSPVDIMERDGLLEQASAIMGELLGGDV